MMMMMMMKRRRTRRRNWTPNSPGNCCRWVEESLTTTTPSLEFGRQRSSFFGIARGPNFGRPKLSGNREQEKLGTKILLPRGNLTWLDAIGQNLFSLDVAFTHSFLPDKRLFVVCCVRIHTLWVKLGNFIHSIHSGSVLLRHAVLTPRRWIPVDLTCRIRFDTYFS
jgi:hypothetical protein